MHHICWRLTTALVACAAMRADAATIAGTVTRNGQPAAGDDDTTVDLTIGE